MGIKEIRFGLRCLSKKRRMSKNLKKKIENENYIYI